MTITINVEKAKEIAHRIRRTQRADEFRPYDAEVAKQIPALSDAAELARQEIRDKYAEMQTQIDAANSVSEFEQILGL